MNEKRYESSDIEPIQFRLWHLFALTTVAAGYFATWQLDVVEKLVVAFNAWLVGWCLLGLWNRWIGGLPGWLKYVRGPATIVEWLVLAAIMAMTLALLLPPVTTHR